MDKNAIVTNVELNLEEIIDVMKSRDSDNSNDNTNVIDSGYHIFCTVLFEYLNALKNEGRVFASIDAISSIKENLSHRRTINGSRISLKNGEINGYRLAYNHFLKEIGEMS